MQPDGIDSDSLRQLFQRAPFLGDADGFASAVRLLHHRYLEMKLAPEQAASAVDIELLQNGAYYLSALATTPNMDAELPDSQLMVNALSVAAMIFEFLGDLAGSDAAYGEMLEEDAVYYLDACICNSLGIYEANSMALARSRLLRGRGLEQILSEPAALEIKALLYSILYTWLARDFASVWRNAERIQQILAAAATRPGEGLIRATYGWRELAHWEIAARAAVAHALSYQAGNEDLIEYANSAFDQARQLAIQYGSPIHYWTISALGRCANRMHQNSVWTTLRAVLPERYIRVLVGSPKPVYELWTSQIRALQAGSAEGLQHGYLDPSAKRVLVNMPTSAGKSLLAEMAIVDALFDRTDALEPASEASCLYVVPRIALVNEVERKLSERLRPLGIRVTGALGGFDSTPLERRVLAQTKVAVLTPEKLSMLARQNDPFVSKCRLLVFDEIHTLDDLSRGWTLEELVTWLKDFHPTTTRAKMLCMSAVIFNRQQLTAWLAPAADGEGLQTALLVDEAWQPTRQLKAVCHFDNLWAAKRSYSTTPRGKRVRTRKVWGHLSYVSESEDLGGIRCIRRVVRAERRERRVEHRNGTKSWAVDYDHTSSAVDLAVDLTSRFLRGNLDPILVFFMKRSEASHFCDRFVALHPELLADITPQLRRSSAYVGHTLGEDSPLGRHLAKGIAFHHGRLPRDVRAEIEHAFRQREIRVLACTTTLADGVNFPIATMILANHSVVTGTDQVRLLGKKDFLNMIGRAGRAVFDTEGQIVFMLPPAGPREAQRWNEYLYPSPEDPDLRTLSPFAHPDLSRSVLQHILQAFEESGAGADPLSYTAVDGDERRDAGVDDAIRLYWRLQATVLLLLDQGLAEPDKPETFLAFLQHTLLGQQAAEAPEGTQELVAQLCTHTARAIAVRVPNAAQRSCFARTGLGFVSCQRLFSFAEVFWADYARTACEQGIGQLPPELLLELGALIFDLPETRPEPIRVSRRAGAHVLSIPHAQVLLDWFRPEHGIGSIASRHFGEITDPGWRSEACISYIYDALQFKAPWALSAFATFVQHLAAQEGIGGFEITPLGSQLSMLPSYARFGVDTPPAAIFSWVGINTKEMANMLADAYRADREMNPKGQKDDLDFSAMLEWLLKLEPVHVARWYSELRGEDTAGQVAHVIQILKDLQGSEVDLQTRLPIDFYVAGWYYHEGETVLSGLAVGDRVLLEREDGNAWDDYAVKVLTESGTLLGYIPMTLSLAVSRLLSSGATLTANVAAINPAPAPMSERLRIHVTLQGS